MAGRYVVTHATTYVVETLESLHYSFPKVKFSFSTSPLSLTSAKMLRSKLVINEMI